MLCGAVPERVSFVDGAAGASPVSGSGKLVGEVPSHVARALTVGRELRPQARRSACNGEASTFPKAGVVFDRHECDVAEASGLRLCRDLLDDGTGLPCSRYVGMERKIVKEERVAPVRKSPQSCIQGRNGSQRPGIGHQVTLKRALLILQPETPGRAQRQPLGE